MQGEQLLWARLVRPTSPIELPAAQHRSPVPVIERNHLDPEREIDEEGVGSSPASAAL